mmetsp:Transcript_1243/g.1264  ORF Transcript_1243/g.1264 Transcript_1243/m.1264 type:complete len:112 (-) Transcript_1243:577-912(-)
METYEQSFRLSVPHYMIPQSNIGRVFNKSLVFSPIVKMDCHPLAVENLESSGCTVYQPSVKNSVLSWDSLAGYGSIKRTIEDSVLFTLTHPDVFSQITECTREKAESNRPR